MVTLSMPRNSTKYINIRIGIDDILFENQNYIIIKKKSGWPVSKTLDPKRPNLFTALKSYLKNREKEDIYLSMPHRLDVNTSGVILFVKKKALNQEIDSLFKEHRISKKYQALVHGSLREKQEIDIYLREEKLTINGKKKSLMKAVKSGGKRAITAVAPIETQGDNTLVDIEIKTGRKHQIRASLSYINHPIVGDLDYGSEQELKNQQCLNAYHLEFQCPLTKEVISATSHVDFYKENDQDSNTSLKYYIFNKPYNVLCQFNKTTGDEITLKDYIDIKGVYPVGRLDKDSEGLLLLTNDGKYQNALANKENEIYKTYIVQVEGIPEPSKIRQLEKGVIIKGRKTLPAQVKVIDDYQLWQRTPPIRERKNIPTTILEIKIREGRNRQIRKMTASIGHPTLRLIRMSIGQYELTKNIKPGECIETKKLS